ncbi:hypothetical protein GCM10009624_18200 [Gordonia sinesedis]
MGSVSHRAVIDAPRDRVFDYVNDYRNVPEYMDGIRTFTPTTDVDEGLGAIFDAELNLGPKTLKSTVEVTEWVRDEVIVLDSIAGFRADTRWRFTDADGGTEMHVEFSYTLPGGLAGKALAALIEPFANQAVKRTEANLIAGVVDTPKG